MPVIPSYNNLLSTTNTTNDLKFNSQLYSNYIDRIDPNRISHAQKIYSQRQSNNINISKYKNIKTDYKANVPTQSFTSIDEKPSVINYIILGLLSLLIF